MWLKKYIKEIAIVALVVIFLTLIVDIGTDIIAGTNYNNMSSSLIMLALIAAFMPPIIAGFVGALLVAKINPNIKAAVGIPAVSVATIIALLTLLSVIQVAITPTEKIIDSEIQGALPDTMQNMQPEELKVFLVQMGIVGTALAFIINFCLAAAGAFLGRMIVVSKKSAI